MSSEDFDDEMDMLDTSNLGNTLRKLKKLDHSDGNPWLSETEYDQLDRIRELRNYWCHQCYLDYIYINVEWHPEAKKKLRLPDQLELVMEDGTVYRVRSFFVAEQQMGDVLDALSLEKVNREN